MKIFDCFTFYNEFELLELRLKSLYDVVDYFVMVESNRTHTNEPKKYNFLERKDDFKEFMPKLRYLMLDASNIPYKGIGDWSIENAQRNSVMQGLKDAAPDDLVFISDLDEIPNPNIVDRLKSNQVDIVAFCPNTALPPPPLSETNVKAVLLPFRPLIHVMDFLEFNPLVLSQKLHYYYLDWVAKEPWHGTVVAKAKNISVPQTLRNYRDMMPRILNGGYHFSYQGGIDRIIKKMHSIVDGNLARSKNPDIVDRKHLQECMAKGKFLDSRNFTDSDDSAEQVILPCDISTIELPALKEFVKKYPQFLRETDI